MKAVILAGGLGTRMVEETTVRPKPMVEIGGKPILWHIMKIYAAHGIQEFVVCCGYKGYIIKEYFAHYCLHMSDVTFDMVTGDMVSHQKNVEPWKVTLVDTGDQTNTGGRLKRVEEYLNGEDFCLTYGDGIAKIDITALIQFHTSHGKLATVTAVQSPSRFGILDMVGTQVDSFREKPRGGGGYINGGYFVLSSKVFDLIENDETVWEQYPLQALASRGELQAYVHNQFWHSMDTFRDKQVLESLWMSGNAPWKIW